jgi:predicted metallopeptidase
MLLLLYDYAVVFLLEAVNNKHKFFADMWAIGAILAELFTLTPIFPGERYF